MFTCLPSCPCPLLPYQQHFHSLHTHIQPCAEHGLPSLPCCHQIPLPVISSKTSKPPILNLFLNQHYLVLALHLGSTCDCNNSVFKVIILKTFIILNPIFDTIYDLYFFFLKLNPYIRVIVTDEPCAGFKLPPHVNGIHRKRCMIFSIIVLFFYYYFWLDHRGPAQQMQKSVTE